MRITEVEDDQSDWRFKATIDRLVGNIPAACKVLREEGHVNLAGQFERDRLNLVYWLEAE